MVGVGGSEMIFLVRGRVIRSCGMAAVVIMRTAARMVRRSVGLVPMIRRDVLATLRPVTGDMLSFTGAAFRVMT